MSKRLFIKTCVLLAVTAHARSQYIDFYQRFNSFLQPFTVSKPRNDVTKRPDTKHRNTNKQKHQDIIYFETDELIKQKENSRTVDPFNLYSTTTKPRRKTTKTSTSHNNNGHTTHSPDFNKPNKSNNSIKVVNNKANHEITRSITSNNHEPYNSNNVDNRVINNARRIDNYNGYNDNNNGYNNFNFNSESSSNTAINNGYGYQGINYNTNYDSNRQTTRRTTTTTEYYNYNARPTTRKTTDYYSNNATPTTRKTNDYYNSNGRPTTRKTTDYYNNGRTTTRKTTDYYNNNGRPTTRKTTDYYNGGQSSFYNNDRTTPRPFNNNGSTQNRRTTSNPLLNRPGVKPAAVDENQPPITNRPVTSRPVYDRPFDTGTFRPANTRPPYETERPLTSGVHRPISSGVRPVTSGVRPSVSATVSDVTEPDIEIGPDEDEMSASEKRRLYDICEQKCDEYKSARVKKVVALPLAPHSQTVEVNVSSCAPTNVPLIIGGEVVSIQQFPHMALVGWRKIQNDGYSWKCGGSLISEQYILTAGHCTYHDKDYNVVSGPPHAVQLGSSLYDDRTATVVQVAAVVRHPKYKLRRSYYDVALIKMTFTVAFSDKISPACLGVPPPVGEPVIATGWGKTEFGGDSSIELRSVSIPVWDMNECREIWGTSLKLPRGPMSDNQICAGERKGAKDTCQGDSGGPAQVQSGCAWRVVAVTSVGRSCGAPDTPALYATVPRAFIAAQAFTNVKPGRDGNNQYGNEGITGNNNHRNSNNNSGTNNYSGTGNNNSGFGNNNSGFGNNNSGFGNNNSGFGNNNRGNVNDQYGNQGVTNLGPVQNTNDQNYNSNGRIQYNNGQYYTNNQGSGSDNRGSVTNSNNGNNGNNFGNNQQNTGNNGWSVNTDTTSNNRNINQNNGNNRYESSQNNENIHYDNQNNGYVNDQSSYSYNGQNQGTTTIGYNNQNGYRQNGYKANGYGQNGYNSEQNQGGRYTENTSNVRNYETQSFAWI